MSGLINLRTHTCPHVLLTNSKVIENPHNETLVKVTIDPRAYASNPWWYTGANAAKYDYSGKRLCTTESEEVVEDEEAGRIEDEGAATDEEAEGASVAKEGLAGELGYHFLHCGHSFIILVRIPTQLIFPPGRGLDSVCTVAKPYY